MNVLERLAGQMALGRAQRKVEHMLGTGWKGKVGAVGVMIGGVASILAGLACAAQKVLVAGDLGSWDQCYALIGGGAVAFSSGLSQYGIRDALGPSKKNGSDQAPPA